MKRFLPIVIVLLLISAAVGWLRAGTLAGPQPPALDGWGDHKYISIPDSEYERLKAVLKSSQFLPSFTQEELDAEDLAAKLAEEASALAAPPFPKVIGASRLNNVAYIHLQEPDLSLLKVKQGDVLDSGWEIISVNSGTLTAVFDEEEINIPVITYLEAAFEKSGEESKDMKAAPSQKAGGGG